MLDRDRARCHGPHPVVRTAQWITTPRMDRARLAPSVTGPTTYCPAPSVAMMVPAIRANESRPPADSLRTCRWRRCLRCLFNGVAFALNARRRAHFSKSGSSQHCVRLGVNLKLAREIHSAHIAGRLRSAARYADLETRGLAQMPLVPEGVLRAAGAPDPAQRGAADGALCLGASGARASSSGDQPPNLDGSS